MPKISVHLEADSAEELRSLLAAFQLPTTGSGITVDGVDLWDGIEPEPKTAPEPAAVVVEAPQKPKRGRPLKTAPVEPEAAPVAAVAEPEPVKVEEPIKATPPKPAKVKELEIVVSRQDLLDVFSEYVQRYGASFGFSDISSLLQKNLGDGVRKASDVPEEKLQVAIGAIKTAIADNPFNRKRDYA